MSHFTTVVALKGVDVTSQVQIDNAIAEVLAPYNEQLDKDFTQHATRADLIASERKSMESIHDHSYSKWVVDPDAYEERYKDNETHLNYMRNEFANEYNSIMSDDDAAYAKATRWYKPKAEDGLEDGEEQWEYLDEEGNLWSKSNENGYWDWYTIGGRWRGFFNATSKGMVTDEFWGGEYEAFEDDGVDIVTVENLIGTPRTPYAYVDSDGVWHSKGHMGWWGMTSGDMEQDKWDAEFREFIESLDEDTVLVALDCHT